MLNSTKISYSFTYGFFVVEIYPKTKKMEEKKNYEIEDYKNGLFTVDNDFPKKLLLNYQPPSNLSCIEYLKKFSNQLKIEKIEEIIKVCEEFLQKLKEKIKIKKINLYNLTDDELFSIIIFTYNLGIKDPSKNFYFIFNKILIKRSETEIKPWLGYIYYLFNALEKLPNQDLTIYRGINNDEINIIYKNDSLVGKLVVCSGFLSGTTDFKIAEDGLIFKIKIHNGKIISNFSFTGTKTEVILLPNSKFIIVESPMIVDGSTFINLIQKNESNVHIENEKKKDEKRKRNDIESIKKIKKIKCSVMKINYFIDLKINFENYKNYHLEINIKKDLILKLKTKLIEKNNLFKQDLIGCGGSYSMIYNGWFIL
jgi:hypothetical protein